VDELWFAAIGAVGGMTSPKTQTFHPCTRAGRDISSFDLS